MRIAIHSARFVCVAAAITATLSGSVETAEAQERKFDISVFAGFRHFDAQSAIGSQNLNDVKVVDGVILGPRVHIKLASRLFLEAEFPIGITKTSEQMETLLVLFLHPRVQAMYALMPDATVQPSLVVGGGVASSDFIHDREIVPQGHAGVAVRFPNRLKWNARLDARYVIGPARMNGVANEFELLLSVYRPEPTPKTDVPKRPTTKDSDEDGIIDREDKCPDDPEDEDGFEDTDGCPDADNDGDEISDTDDKCPVEPETKNNYKDDDGCPDEVPIAIQSFTGNIDGINFELNSANLTRESYPVLDEAVKKLQEFEDLKVSIVGHTDDQGTDEYNLDLSQRRADTVRLYLVSRGVDENRLKAVGMGMRQPVTDNDTEQGRAQNRRVEFIIR